MLLAQLDNRTIMNIAIYLTLFFTVGFLLNYKFIAIIPGLKYWLASLIILDAGLLLLAGQSITANWISVGLANALIGLAVAGFGIGTNKLMGRPVKYWFYLGTMAAFLAGVVYLTVTIHPVAGLRVMLSSIYLALVIGDAAVAVLSNAPAELRFPFWIAGAILLSIMALFLMRAIAGFYAPLAHNLFAANSVYTLGMVFMFYGLTAWIICMLILINGHLFYQRELSSDADFKLIIDSSNAAHWSIDFVNNRRYYSKEWSSIVGRPVHLEDYLQWREIVHPDDYPRIIKAIDDHLAGNTPHFSVEHRVRRKDGKYHWLLAKGKIIRDADGNYLKAAGSHMDIDNIKLKEEEIYNLACHDTLTGLLNRYSLALNLEKLLSEENPAANTGAFIFIDLDDFKLINGSFGHPAGDELLVLIARRLQTLIDENLILARLGGDEFIIYIKSAAMEQELEPFMHRLMALFAEPFSINDSAFDITASVGVALYPEHGKDLDTLLMNADAAMYQAKEAGKNHYRVYEPRMTKYSEAKLMLDRDLRYAITNHEFELHYQPILSPVTYEVLGFEALIRWIKGDECIMPADFIPRSEENGLIVPIGAWVMEQACSFGAEIHNLGMTQQLISVNISAIQIIQDGFVPMVKDVLTRTGMPPGHLLLEITETAMMNSFKSDTEKLQELRNLGVHLALDDFGTGYSSLNYLKNLPVNLIKLDRTFLDDIEGERQKSIMETIITIAHRLGIKVLAEGIETPDQFDFLVDLSCDLVQGFLFSYPLPAGQALELVKSIQAQK